MTDPTHKIAEDHNAARDMQETYEGKPHGWVQWKGTDVCMDFHCVCGEHTHIDASFAYYLKCVPCGRVYMLNGHIEAIELKTVPDNCVVEAD